MPFNIPANEIVDAEVVSETPREIGTPAGVINLKDPNTFPAPPPPQQQPLFVQAEDGSFIQISPLDEQRGRAIALFVRVPVLTYVALNSRVPMAVRILAGALAAWDAFQLAQQSQEIEALLPELPQ